MQLDHIYSKQFGKLVKSIVSSNLAKMLFGLNRRGRRIDPPRPSSSSKVGSHPKCAPLNHRFRWSFLSSLKRSKIVLLSIRFHLTTSKPKQALQILLVYAKWYFHLTLETACYSRCGLRVSLPESKSVTFHSDGTNLCAAIPSDGVDLGKQNSP